jgi:DNA-binding transcriptional MerR regulator
MEKSPDAFRTISEVAEILETPAHVLRFWESRFPQIRPVKRAGGRRYYRPSDVALLTGIKHLLHYEGLTIRGVQKMLREQGVRHVAGLSGQDVPDESASAEAALEAALAANFAPPAPAPLPREAAESAQIVALETALKARRAQATDPEVAAASPVEPALLTSAPVAAPIAELAVAPAPIAAPESPSEAARKPAPAPAEELPLFARATAPAPQRLVDRLRQLPPGSLDSPAARALRDRLVSLQSRVEAPPATNPI